VAYVLPNHDGVITPKALSEIITKNTILVSVMMSNNETGVIQPISELVKIAHQNGAVFHTDAVQCLGHINVDVQALGVDMLSASAHKFNGPKGVGFLYIKNGTPIFPLMDGGAQEKGNRAGTENVASIVAMAVALENNLNCIGEQSKHIKMLENRLLSLLTEYGIHYARNGAGEMIPGNVSLGFPGFEGEALLHRLDLLGVQVSTGSACDSVNTQISHVLKAMEVDMEIAKGTIRVSLGKYNKVEDVEFIADAINKIINC
jgi:cysteine desulfurase